VTLQVQDPVATAKQLAASFRVDAAARDLAAGTPEAERRLLRESGLLTLMQPVEVGGPGSSWPVVLATVREIATADSSLAHLYAYHHLGAVTPALIGSPAQQAHWGARTVAESLVWGNALNPLDPRTSLARQPDGSLRLSGEKSFCTGARGSDLLLVSASLPGEPQLQVMVLPTSRAGILIRDDWDNMGQRQTDSGSVGFRDVEVHPEELLGPPGAGGSVFATLRPCVTQSILSTIYLGLARGAFEEARAYTQGLERPFFGSTAERATDDPYVLAHYGELYVQIEAAAGLLDAAGRALQAAWVRGQELTAEERGECAARVSMAKVATGRCALEVTSTMFEMMGARATAGRHRLDRFWRNARTLTLHDPLDYKVREVGEFALNGRVPKPTFYS
jgi:alkylation response protein AidB-like acyl-CoA dehydrogenase